MTHFEIKRNARLDEAYLYGKHKSGLEVFIIPKKHKKVFAIFGTRYGSVHRCFKTDADADFITVPDGIAHFLEHKLFENEDGTDTFSLFGKYGASANAFTSNEMTAYLFSATDNYYENLEILLKFVTSPYFTKETVDKEMGIIGQELRMYLDNPYRRLYKNLLDALYVDSYAKIDVGGTEESISHITPEVLYRCYGTFYNLHNMTLCLCGDFDVEKVDEVCDRILKQSEPISISESFPEEPRRVNRERVCEEFSIALPMFYCGIKETDIRPETPSGYMKRDCEHRIINELLFGKSSDFYNDMYEQGLINDKFMSGYSMCREFAFMYTAAETRQPDKVISLIRSEIEKALNGLYDAKIRSEFERCKRVIYSDALQEWNSTTDIAECFLETHFIGADMLDTPDIIASLTVEDIFSRLKKSYDLSLMASSIIVPKGFTDGQ